MHDKAFNCLLSYVTPARHVISVHCKTIAIAADAALEIAERQLRADKRRKVVRVVYGKAIEQ